MSRLEVEELIEALRTSLVKFAHEKPLFDPQVVSLSQRLDELLNYYHNTILT